MVTTFYPPYSFGGDAIGVQRLAYALKRRGHNVTIVYNQDAYRIFSRLAPQATLPENEVTTIALRSPAGLLACFLMHQLGRPVIHRRQLKSILKPGAFDIIWYHNISLIGGPGIISYGDGLKVYEAHEHWLVCPTHVLWRHKRELCDSRQCIRCAIHYRRPPQLWRYTRYLDRQLDQIDVVIAKSEFSRQKHAQFGLSKSMEVIPYFLPDEAKHKRTLYSSPNPRPYFLFVGRLEIIKGLEEPIRIFTNYKEADLLIIGSGDNEVELKRMCIHASNIKFLGAISSDQLRQYYQHAIALIVPSVCFETFGIVIIEAFREATPVVARDLGPFGEIVNRSGGGLLYSDADGLMNALRKLQWEPSFRKELAYRASSGFSRLWSETSVMNKYFYTLRTAALAKNNINLARTLEEQLSE